MSWKDKFPKGNRYFETDSGILYLGDATEILAMLPDNEVDLMITSPPYNIGIKYENWNDRMPWDKYFEWTEKWLREALRVIKPIGGRACINHYLSLGSGARGNKIGSKQGNNQGLWYDSNRLAPLMEINSICSRIGYKHHSVVVWEDITLSRKTAWGSWLSASSPYINSPYEGILINFKDVWKKDGDGMNTINEKDFVSLTRGIWEIGTDSSPYTVATFPIKLPVNCINLLTYVNDLVIDPFVGSGTTGIAAEKMGRRWIGIEISEKYAKIASRRISEASMSLF